MQLTLLIAAALAAGPPQAGAKARTSPAPEPAAACEADPTEILDEKTWRARMLEQLEEPPELHVEPPDADPFAFSSFRGVRPEPMGEETIINGAVMKIASMTVDLPPHVVEDEYFAAFEKAQVSVLRGLLPDSRGVRYLSYRPQGSRNLKTLTFIPTGPGTVILASVGDPSPMVEPQPDVPEGFPLPPASEGGVSIRQSEPGAQSRSTTFRVRGVNTQQIRNFYRQELGKLGYQRQGGDDEAESFTNEVSLLSVAVRPDAEPDAVSVTVMWLK